MYSVEWIVRAMEQMDQLFMLEDPVAQARLIKIVRGMERELGLNPHALGESREGGSRLAFFEMLAVRFLIDEAKKVVRITRVQRYGN